MIGYADIVGQRAERQSFFHTYTCSRLAEVLEVGTGRAFGGGGEFLRQGISVYTHGELQWFQIVSEDCRPTGCIRELHPDYTVEPSWPAQGCVDRVGTVGSRQDEYTVSRLQPIK